MASLTCRSANSMDSDTRLFPKALLNRVIDGFEQLQWDEEHFMFN
jgi:hypothetical protein